MENYKPNSDKYREGQQKDSEKKVEKVITGVAKAKKKSEVRRFADSFLADIWSDVMVPAIKKIITESIDTMLYGQPRRSSNITSSTASYNSNNYWKASNSGGNNQNHGNYRSGGSYNYNDIVVESRGEAEDVLSRMDDLIATYGVVSVADLYDLVGITGKYTDNKYGWSDIKSANVVRVGDGYLLKLPKALPLT